MASLNPSSDISAFINTVYEAALLVARDNNVMTGLVRTFNDRTGVATRKNSQYGGASVNSITETDDLVGQAFTPANVATLTPAEVGAQYVMTDTRIESDPFSVRIDAATDLGQAMATKIETDLIGSFSSLTGGTVGTAGSVLTWGYFMAMEAQLKAQKAPYPYFFVCHPYQWFQLAKAASVASSVATNIAPSLAEEVNQAFFVRQMGGVSIFVSSNFTIDGSGDTTTAMFSRDALALDMRRAPRIEPDRDPSRRAWELNLSAVYAKGVWRPTFGIQGIYDCTAPTGV
jgi:hypothetical protein